MDGVVRDDLVQHLSLFNGQANLTVSLPAGAADGDTHVFETEIQDDYIANIFESVFYINVIRAEEPRSGGVGVPHRPTDPKKKGNQQTPSRFAIPENIPVKREDWDQRGMDRFSALVYVPTDEGDDYYLNMENDYLLTELKGIREQSRIELTKARYTYSMALIGMSIISYYINKLPSGCSFLLRKGDEEIGSVVKMLSKSLTGANLSRFPQSPSTKKARFLGLLAW